MRAYIKLFRPLNLFIIALTQYLVLFYLIRPVLRMNNYDILISHFDFAVFVISNVLLAAAGYAINDYYDVDMDAINKPEKNVLISKVPRKRAYNINIMLNVIACLLGIYCAIKVGNFKLGFLPIVIALALFYYSLKYKRQFLTGNIVVGLVIAYSILVVWLFQFFAIKSQPEVFVAAMNTFKIISAFVGGMAVFAFLITVIREMVKDIEDLEGDKISGSDTVPVRLGIPKTKTILLWISLFTMLLLAFAQYKLYHDFVTTAFYLFVLQIMFVYFILKMRKAGQKSDYHFLSTFLKIMMIAGLLATQMLSINF